MNGITGDCNPYRVALVAGPEAVMATADQPGSGYSPGRVRKGTRMLRWRSLRRAPQQGQPVPPLTHPDIEHQETEPHVCAECFGPRSAYRRGQFCYNCELALFGDGTNGYETFVRSERQHRIRAARKGKPPRPKDKSWSPSLRNLDLPELGARVSECLKAENIGGPEWRAVAIANRARNPRSRR